MGKMAVSRGSFIKSSDAASAANKGSIMAAATPIEPCQLRASRSAARPAAVPPSTASASAAARGGVQPTTAASPTATMAAGAAAAGSQPARAAAPPAHTPASKTAGKNTRSGVPKKTAASPNNAASDKGEVKKCWEPPQIDLASPRPPCAHAEPQHASPTIRNQRLAPDLRDTRHASENPHAGSRDQSTAGTQYLPTLWQGFDHT